MLQPGATVGSYEILGVVGRGGMGEVYAARDTVLGRTVALKVLPNHLSRDAGRRRRLEREARVIAALSHPGIVTIHSIEHDGPLQFLTMELVQGRTLDTTARPMPLQALLEIFVPLVDAVCTVHQAGVTHRDLKPTNVMLCDDGRIKILDFGLARLADDVEPASARGAAATATTLTGNGQMLGTVAYMAPEQAEGVTADARSDIFSVGVMLFEMSTGRRPFDGDSGAALVASLLRDTPPLASDVDPGLPLEFSRIVRRCLIKDPEHRYQSAKDLRNALDELRQELRSSPSPAVGLPAAAPPPFWRLSNRWWLAAGLGLATAAGATFLLTRETPATKPLVFTRLTSQAGIEEHPSLSPDGRWMVYSAPAGAGRHVFLQGIGGDRPIDLSVGSEANDTQPSFSPDGEHIVFRSEKPAGIYVMGRTGEFRRRLADRGYNPAWAPDGREIVYSTERIDTNPYNREGVAELWAVGFPSGPARRVYAGDAVQPAWSPDGRRIAFWAVADDGGRDVFTVPAAGGRSVAVTTGPAADFSPAWSPDGAYLLFSSDRSGSPNLWRVAIDSTSGQVLGPAEPMSANSPWATDAAVSHDGRAVVFTSVQATANIQRFDLDPSSGTPSGPGLWITTGSAFRRYLDVSPDGTRLVFGSGVGQEDIFISNADGTNLRQVTNDLARDRRPTWSPDGRLIAFESTRSGPYQIWTVDSDGEDLRLLTDNPAFRFNYHAWSPTGDRMFTTSTATWKGLLFDPRHAWHAQHPEMLPAPPFVQFSSMSWSPDGRRLAGWSPDGIAVYDYQTKSYSALTHDNGAFPQWLGSERLIYTAGSNLMLIGLDGSAARAVLSVAPDLVRNVALSRDGRRLYIVRGANEGDIWMARLE